jgi:FMN-dependent oxidoreductase (nitrilotriacetate monooxygenase family)
MPRPHLILSAFFFNPQGDHRVSWRHPRAPGREILDFAFYRDLAERAERARFDVLFVADELAIWDQFESGIAHYANIRLEPLTLLSALSVVTRHIGLIATASTTYNDPFHIARKFASLDFLSGGRASWNVVTSAMDEEALNFGSPRSLEHARRYARADEFIEVVTKLWDSWDEDALLIDKASGYFADPAHVHHLDHAGPHFSVRGPLNLLRPPQGHPVLVQAGSSDAGLDLAASRADMHFALIKNVAHGREYRSDLARRLARFGRGPDELIVLPGVIPVVADSADEAAEKQAVFQRLMLDRVAIDLLSYWTGMDLAALPPDGPLPPLPDEAQFNGVRSMLSRIRELARDNLPIRDVARRMANSGSIPTFAGTPRAIADQMEEWFTGGAADGFNLMFPLLPEDLILFAEQVVPELRRRGLVPQDYAEGTLRARLGLPRPPSRFAPSATSPATANA